MRKQKPLPRPDGALVGYCSKEKCTAQLVVNPKVRVHLKCYRNAPHLNCFKLACHKCGRTNYVFLHNLTDESERTIVDCMSWIHAHATVERTDYDYPSFRIKQRYIAEFGVEPFAPQDGVNVDSAVWEFRRYLDPIPNISDVI